MDVHFNKGSPKSSCTFSLSKMLPLEDVVSYQDEEVNEKGEGLNQFDPSPIYDNYGDDEILGFEDYGDKELLELKELREALASLLFCEEEKLAHKEDFHVSF